ncbi:MAG: hypothetical protein PHG11_09110 [Eubacteriales bacterium]|jgi:hypothetical protein|nr:hypothetical protein [Eubacteriales bacterium]MDD3110081.1 hypothetical protein [Eubacteriales bacterium]MDD4134698.1 hypothetical protein [Eubacteriales bacterium]NLO12981.1 hypothetical protein [Clostridiales bacterium]
MLYCADCRELMDAPCPKRRHVTRVPEEGDPVLLFRGDAVQAGILDAMLKEAGLPFLREGRLGSGLTAWAGEMLESYSIYVPFALYDKANELAMVLKTPPQGPDAGTEAAEQENL